MTVADELAFYASQGLSVQGLSVSDARARFYRGVLDGSIPIGGTGSGSANYTDNGDGTITFSSDSTPSVTTLTEGGAFLAFVSVVDKDTQQPIVAPPGHRFVGLQASLDMSNFPDVLVWDLVPVFESTGSV